MRIFVQSNGTESAHKADCVTILVGDLNLSICPEGMELSMAGDDESSPMWVEMSDIIKLAKGDRVIAQE